MDLPDFDCLVKLARQNPEEFELLRETLIEDTITSARQDSQRRLRGLQFQIDMARRRSKTPLAACIRISSMMQASLVELRDFVNGDSLTSETESNALLAAKVLNFKTRTNPA